MAEIGSVVPMQPSPDLSTGRHKVVTLEAFGNYPDFMSKRIASILLLALSFPALAHAQLADVSCDDSARLTKTLTQVMGAERQGMGLRYPETMLEVWVTRRNGDWMIVQNYANGTSCIVAMGDHWEGVTDKPDPA